MQSDKKRASPIIVEIRQRMMLLKSGELKDEIIKKFGPLAVHAPKLIPALVDGYAQLLLSEYNTFILPLIDRYGVK